MKKFITLLMWFMLGVLGMGSALAQSSLSISLERDPNDSDPTPNTKFCGETFGVSVLYTWPDNLVNLTNAYMEITIPAPMVLLSSQNSGHTDDTTNPPDNPTITTTPTGTILRYDFDESFPEGGFGLPGGATGNLSFDVRVPCECQYLNLPCLNITGVINAPDTDLKNSNVLDFCTEFQDSGAGVMNAVPYCTESSCTDIVSGRIRACLGTTNVPPGTSSSCDTDNYRNVGSAWSRTGYLPYSNIVSKAFLPVGAIPLFPINLYNATENAFVFTNTLMPSSGCFDRSFTFTLPELTNGCILASNIYYTTSVVGENCHGVSSDISTNRTLVLPVCGDIDTFCSRGGCNTAPWRNFEFKNNFTREVENFVYTLCIDTNYFIYDSIILANRPNISFDLEYQTDTNGPWMGAALPTITGSSTSFDSLGFPVGSIAKVRVVANEPIPANAGNLSFQIYGQVVTTHPNGSNITANVFLDSCAQYSYDVCGLSFTNYNADIDDLAAGTGASGDLCDSSCPAFICPSVPAGPPTPIGCASWNCGDFDNCVDPGEVVPAQTFSFYNDIRNSTISSVQYTAAEICIPQYFHPLDYSLTGLNSNLLTVEYQLYGAGVWQAWPGSPFLTDTNLVVADVVADASTIEKIRFVFADGFIRTGASFDRFVVSYTGTAAAVDTNGLPFTAETQVNGCLKYSQQVNDIWYTNFPACASQIPTRSNNVSGVDCVFNCDQFSICPPAPLPCIEKLLNNEQVETTVQVGDIIPVTLIVRNRRNDAPITDAVVSDLLPPGMSFVFTNPVFSIMTSSNATDPESIAIAADPYFDLFQDWNGTGREMVRFTWGDLNYPLYLLDQGAVTITYHVRVDYLREFKNQNCVDLQIPSFTTEQIKDYYNTSSFTIFNCGNNLNCTATGSQENGDIRDSFTSNPNVYQFYGQGDWQDLDSDLITNESTIRDCACYRTSGTGAAANSFKWVKGAYDPDFTRTPNTGYTFAGGPLVYQMEIINIGADALNDWVMIDILPHLGDVQIIDGVTPRLTDWVPCLDGPLVLPVEYANATVYYSMETNPCTPEVSSSQIGCVTANWTTVFPPDPCSVRSFKVDFGNLILNTGERIFFEVPMTAPTNAPEGEIAWNSFAFDATPVSSNVSDIPPSEPLKVGVEILDCGILGEPYMVKNCINPGFTPDVIDDQWTLDFSLEQVGLDGSTFSMSGAATGSAMAYSTDGFTPLHTVGPFNIFDGPITLVFNDDTSPNKTLTLVVDPPFPCSSCLVTNLNPVVVCDDNGTPFDETDDTVFISITPQGIGGSATYNITGDVSESSLPYGQEHVLYSGPAIGGDISILISDAIHPVCSTPFEYSLDDCLPDGCFMLIDSLVPGECELVNGSSLVYDLEVTLIYQELQRSGSSLRIQHNGVEFPFTPPVGAGTLNSGLLVTNTFTLQNIAVSQTDQVVVAYSFFNQDCRAELVNGYDVPGCCLIPPVDVVDSYCDQNGTRSDPSDDVFYAELNFPEGVDTGSGFTIIGDYSFPGPYMYGTNFTIGPFPFSNSVNLVAVDLDGDCTNAFVLSRGRSCAELFDLALRKDLKGPRTVSVGQTVDFIITVFNQGDIPATNVVVTDYIPLGLSLQDSDWTSIGAQTAEYTLLGVLFPREQTNVVITLQVDAAPQGGIITNWAEISEDNYPEEDIDSTPDGTNFNDMGETDDLDDDNVTNENGFEGGDEDDHDPAIVRFVPGPQFDLALAKFIGKGQAEFTAPGSNISFQIVVYNQGDIPATNVVVTDYIPMGLNLNDPAWMQSGATATFTIDGVIPPGKEAFLDINFTVDPSFMGGVITNWAEISEDNSEVADVDSDPDDDNFDSDGETDDLDDDNVVDEDGKEGGDEDDHDPAIITVIIPPEPGIFDLALLKRLAPGQVPTLSPGGDVTFDIIVINQGTIAATNVVVTDYIPTGLSLNDTSWNELGGLATYTLRGVLNPGASTNVTIQFTVDPNHMGGSITNWAEISEDNSATPDVDSDPDDDNFDSDGETDDLDDDNVVDEDGKDGGDEDDHDPEVITVLPPPEPGIFDLALLKRLAPGQVPTLSPGGDVTFDIIVINQGTIAATNVVVTDYIPTGLSLNDTSWNELGGLATYTLRGVLNPGASTNVTIQFTVDPNHMGGSITNWAEISEDNSATPDVDSDPDDDNFDSDGETDDLDDDNVVDEDGKDGGDEDDHDPEVIEVSSPVEPLVFDLALFKSLATDQPSVVNPGATVTFTITVMNQGQIPATNIFVTDYLPPNTMLATGSAWIDNLDGTATVQIPGTIGVDEAVEVDISLVLDSSFTSGVLTNWAEISEDNSAVGDEDSTPDATNDDPFGGDDVVDNTDGDEDDHDPAEVTVVEAPIFDLALRKQLAENQAALVQPGSEVTFTITVFNQGTVPAQNMVISDYIPAGLTLADSDWTEVDANLATIMISGPLAPEQSLTVDITFVVNTDFTGTAVNFAEISDAQDPDGNHPEDIDSTPDSNPDNDGPVTDEEVDNSNGDEDDHDPAEIRAEIFDLALIKTLSPLQAPSVAVGDLVTFTITVFNQGTLDAQDVEVTDYIPTGMQLEDSDWTAAGANATIVLTGTLAAGTQRQVDITLRVISGAGSDLVNYAEISEDNSPLPDVDSTPDDNADNDGPVTDDATDNMNDDQDDHDPATITVKPEDVFDLALRKVLSVGQDSVVSQGDLVDFTITIFNQGNLDAHDIQVVDYIPTGFILADSNWIDGGGNLAFRTIVGPIAPGGEEAITIRLQVVDGSGDLVNFAEILIASDTPGGAPRQDIDSTPDQTKDDDTVLDNVTDNTGGDEDDHDPAAIRVEEVSLGDYVWFDTNIDGIQNSDEPGVDNVTVYLLDANGNRIPGKSTVTDSTGYYSFDGLPLGTYAVEFDLSTLPQSYVVTLQNAGGDDAADSDVDPVTGRTPNTALLVDAMRDPTLDMGIYKLGTIDGVFWLDMSNNGSPSDEMLSSAGISGVTIRLYSMESGQPVLFRELVTGPGGEFCFMDVPAGDYRVEYSEDILESLEDGLSTGQTPSSYDVTLTPGESDKESYFAVIPAPTAIELLSFDASEAEEGTLVRWTTASETDSLGFEIWLGNNEGPSQKISDLIFAENASHGASYSFAHATGDKNTVYWLREISLDLKVESYGPTSAAPVPLVLASLWMK